MQLSPTWVAADHLLRTSCCLCLWYIITFSAPYQDPDLHHMISLLNMSCRVTSSRILQLSRAFTVSLKPPAQRRSLSSLPLAIKPSADEIAKATLSWKNLQIATRALHRDGLVVLEDAIETPILDRLNSKMVADAEILRSAGENSPYNYNKGNLQQDPPLMKQLFSPSVYLNPLARQVVHSVLGPQSRLAFISGNSAMPPTPESPPQSQPVHSDADFNHPDCPFALVVNIPLVDMTPENGSTEIWLGTHSLSNVNAQEGAHGERASGRINVNILEDRRRERPPSQPVVKKGSIILRDLRLWHAGKPNFSSDTRVMLALIHFAGWYQ